MQLFGDVFKEHQLTTTVNRVQSTYEDFLGDLFPARGLLSDTISIEEMAGTLTMIPFESQGGPGVVGKDDKRKLRTIKIPTLTFSEHVSSKDVEAVRAFGGNQLQNMAAKVAEKLIKARKRHDLTRAHMRAGAIRGEIRGADGITPYLNLFSEFGITEKVIDLKLGTAGTDLREVCMEINRHMEDSMLGDSMSGVMVEMPPELMSRFVAHASIKDIYRGWAAAASQMGGDYRKGFRVGDTGVTFREQRARAASPTGGIVRFIPADEGRAYPVGTGDSFQTFIAPADFNSTVNTVGQEYYAKSKPGEWDRGHDILTMSCTLPICKRPEVLVKIVSSN